MKIQPEKVIFLTKKLKFFRFFHFSPKARGPLKIFDVQFSEIFKKNIQKWLHWDLSDIEWNKVMDFGEAIPIPLDTADGFTVGRDDLTPPRSNRVNIFINEMTSFSIEMSLFIDEKRLKH